MKQKNTQKASGAPEEGDKPPQTQGGSNMTGQTTTQRKTFLYVISTQYERELVGKTLEWRNGWEFRETSAGRQMPTYGVTLTWKPLWEVKPGEQDIVLAGGREQDEDLVKALRGTGQIVIRYSQLGLNTPYSGRTVEELGYSFLAEKRRADIHKLIYSQKFLEGLANRDPQTMLGGLLYAGIYPTDYLEECCKIPVSATPENLIQEAISNEQKEITESKGVRK
jgi:hypothetical protein